GWAGLFCNESCPHGTFGAGCLQLCLCLNGGTCDGTTGRCHCPPGYTDEHCSSLCPSDTFGVNCSERCSCQHGVACSPIDGSCICKEAPPHPQSGVTGTAIPSATVLSATTPGTTSPSATLPNADLIPEPQNGTFGAGCGQRCKCAHADGCDPITGECHCLPGWTGNPDQPYTIVPAPPLPYSTLGMVVSLVALVALLVAVVTVALCYRRRQKGKENRHLAVAYTAGRTDTSEYMVPGERHAAPRLRAPQPRHQG
ncbi:hypothetical protein CIB84_015929, partial [Bambusicola thoracicus]